MDNFAFFVMIKQVILIVLNNNKGAKMFSKELGVKLDKYHLLNTYFLFFECHRPLNLQILRRL